MKLSASIYAHKGQSLEMAIRELDEHGIDFYHVDCTDDLSVFNDIAVIRQFSDKPIDLHIITPNPERFFEPLETHQVEYVTFQYETLTSPLHVPTHLSSRWGLAISSDTSVDVFETYRERMDFILIMATTPGKSGGHFNKKNFKKIRRFGQLYPEKRIHVDGGVNAEISFILRNMGVYASVSGSYLFNSNYLGAAMLNLKGEDFTSNYRVQDFMLSNGEVPVLQQSECTLVRVLQALEDYRLGFVIIADEHQQMQGIITNADVRKGLLTAIDDLNNLDIQTIINHNPVRIQAEDTVNEMLHHIRAQRFPINYVPVVNTTGQVVGAMTFFNLIKGE